MLPKLSFFYMFWKVVGGEGGSAAGIVGEKRIVRFFRFGNAGAFRYSDRRRCRFVRGLAEMFAMPPPFTTRWGRGCVRASTSLHNI